jgi:hypothetical protein
MAPIYDNEISWRRQSGAQQVWGKDSVPHRPKENFDRQALPLAVLKALRSTSGPEQFS